jgi:cell division protein ZapA
MSDVSIKISVGGRTYPLTVHSADEARVHKAAETVNKIIDTLRQNYAVKDMQDLLAMTALQLASQHSEINLSPEENKQLEEINNLLIQALGR